MNAPPPGAPMSAITPPTPAAPAAAHPAFLPSEADGTPPASLRLPLRRVITLAVIAGLVEVIGYMDVGGIYPGIMTGNTVQLGVTLGHAQWTRFGLIAIAVLCFFLGGIISSVLKRHLRRPMVELLCVAGVLVVATIVRLWVHARVPIELPLLALAMAMQGETISKFGGVSIQTIVVTNNMVKFSDALVGRYLSGHWHTWQARRQAKQSTQRQQHPSPAYTAARPSLAEVVLPGCAWLFYSIAAGLGALIAEHFRFPLLVPAALLLWLAWDMWAVTP